MRKQRISTEAAEKRYEIQALGHWRAVDRANELRDGCLHWQVGQGEEEEYGIARAGKWRRARAKRA